MPAQWPTLHHAWHAQPGRCCQVSRRLRNPILPKMVEPPMFRRKPRMFRRSPPMFRRRLPMFRRSPPNVSSQPPNVIRAPSQSHQYVYHEKCSPNDIFLPNQDQSILDIFYSADVYMRMYMIKCWSQILDIENLCFDCLQKTNIET